MTIQEKKTAIEEARALWQFVMPDVTLPDTSTFLIWIGRYPAATIEYAIARSAAKHRQMLKEHAPMPAENVARYASSTMHHLTERAAQRAVSA